MKKPMMMTGSAVNFRIQQKRNTIIDSLSLEYLSILAILYGGLIESGQKRISDYGAMTFAEAENEFRLRTLMIKGQRIRKKRELQEEHAANERAMLEQLKRATG